MKLQRSTPERKSGHTLLVTLVTLVIIGLVLISYLRLSANQNQLITRSQVWNACLALAEAGIEEALNHVVYNGTNLPSNDWTLQGTRYALSNVLSDGRYSVSISQTAWPRDIISYGYYPMPVSGKFVSRVVRVTTTNVNPLFAGLVVRTVVDLNGNNVLVDSFDSRDPLKSTGGRYDPAKAGDRGTVVCVQGVTDSLYGGDADIYSYVYTGPTATLRVGPNGGVGTHAWRAAGNNGVQDGHWIKDFNMSFPDAKLPYSSAPTPGGGTYNGVNYATILGSGNWMATRLSGNTLVTGNATILVTDRIDYNTGTLQILPGASLRIYMAGEITTFGTTINGSGVSTNLLYFGLPTNKRVEIKTFGAAFTGAVYAPNAELVINGANHLYGGAVVNSARMVGNCQLHFDEALSEGEKNGVVITSWEEL